MNTIKSNYVELGANNETLKLFADRAVTFFHYLQEVAYKDLTSGGGQWPKGLDKTKLETYLSDAEFSSVFNLSRVAFYRLPEWKRNDLKRRVHLF